MRLLHAKSFELKEFIGSSGNGTPPYAILSHTWGEDEVLFRDVCDGLRPGTTDKLGWAKVRFSCEQAISDGYDHVWIDTCCIDKSSSAELSEAINSMFRWYQDAAICYAYLADVDADVGPSLDIRTGSHLRELVSESRWFTRGWTLQELIAPQDVRFYTASWAFIASRERDDVFRDLITQTTGIPNSVLERGSCCPSPDPKPNWDGLRRTCQTCDQDVGLILADALSCHSIAERMSWAATRQTTRVEDRAYSLLGLFGVSMPLLYGEGNRAFLRLQEEIIKISDDHTILAFKTSDDRAEDRLLAQSPGDFHRSYATLVPENISTNHPGSSSMILTSKYIQVEVLLVSCKLEYMSPEPEFEEDEICEGRDHSYLGILSCGTTCDALTRLAIVLEKVDPTGQTYSRVQSNFLVRVQPLSLTARVHAGRSWNGGRVLCEYDLREARTDIIRLLITHPQNSHPGSRGLKLTDASLALRVFHPQPIIWILACPSDGTPYQAMVSISGGGDIGSQMLKWVAPENSQTGIRDFKYIPSIRSTRRQNRPYDRLGREGIISLFLVPLKKPLWIIWGHVGPGDRLWCKILDAEALDISIPKTATRLEDLHSWAYEHQPNLFASMTDDSNTKSRNRKDGWRWEWEKIMNFQIHNSGIRRHSFSTDTYNVRNQSMFVRANIRWAEFLGHRMAEMEIEVFPRRDTADSVQPAGEMRNLCIS
ncbi:heterokaryon incompatibility protein-domain-containing protein [Cercophora newfieldiana]|uniref:Heterokaryon incompatibility protein-domain-containing protein n=1 Tax=Cercophora newfieldiana TaxID=92897 RepID=A0AA40CRW4_9PEZI|nr:heterokaryon incompatibility protein-domain-containing protein [Cercophora newfieldiana]